MALFLLTKVRFSFFWLEHYGSSDHNVSECRAENTQLLQKYSVNRVATGVFCQLDFCFCSGSDFLLVVNT